MLRAWILFLYQVLQCSDWRPVWLSIKDADSEHFHRRRFTKKYQKKQRLVRSMWFGVLLLILAFPAPWFAVSSSLLTTFLSFTILDETE